MIKFDGVYTVTIHMELDEDDNTDFWAADIKENMKKFPNALKEYIEDEISNGPKDKVTVTANLSEVNVEK